MQTRTHHAYALAAVAALALFAGACADVPTTSPGARTPADDALRSASAGQPALVSNAVKYRDQGGKPARGRSGSAEVEALALLAKDGTTTLQVNARHVDGARVGTGEITKLQLKAFASDGGLKLTRNLHDRAARIPVVLPGLSRGEPVQVQANVRGLDRSRTGVVTVTETVKRRADLGIRLATAPAALPGQPTVIMATITEQNGDVGSRATCELLVRGEVVDDARSIWVDAGDMVGCAFTRTFSEAGSYALTARVRTDGGDWDEVNNTDTATLQVRAREPEAFTVQADLYRIDFIDTTWTSTTWRNLADGTAGESEEFQAWRNIDGTAAMTGFLPHVVIGPVHLQVWQETGDVTLFYSDWTLSETGTDWCTDSRADTQGWSGWVFVCSASGEGGGYSTIEMWGYLGHVVTYHGIEFGRAWDELTGAERYVYHRESEWSTWDPGPPLGDTYTWRVRMQAADGDYHAEKTLRLSYGRTSWAAGDPVCWTDELPDYISTRCERRVMYSDWVTGY